VPQQHLKQVIVVAGCCIGQHALDLHGRPPLFARRALKVTEQVEGVTVEPDQGELHLLRGSYAVSHLRNKCATMSERKANLGWQFLTSCGTATHSLR